MQHDFDGIATRLATLDRADRRFRPALILALIASAILAVAIADVLIPAIVAAQMEAIR